MYYLCHEIRRIVMKNNCTKYNYRNFQSSSTKVFHFKNCLQMMLWNLQISKQSFILLTKNSATFIYLINNMVCTLLYLFIYLKDKRNSNNIKAQGVLVKQYMTDTTAHIFCCIIFCIKPTHITALLFSA